MRLLRLIPEKTAIDFMGQHIRAFGFTLALSLVALASLAYQGLSLGIDFSGGLLVEARFAQPVDLAKLRSELATLNLGGVTLQTFGNDNAVLIRAQAPEGDERAQAASIDAIKKVLGPQAELRRTEFIGPQISGELLRGGLIAAILAVLAIAVYVWFRFEWQFGVSALLTTLHDVLTTFGLFSLFKLEFDMTVVAAILTIAGYSINDTVVVFDRVRENLRKYKAMKLYDLINLTVNQTLSRTVLTAGTTLLSALALLFFGGAVLFNFALAMTWGIIIGTYSSIFVASALLLYFKPRAREESGPAAAQAAKP